MIAFLPAGWSIPEIAKWIVVIAAIVACVYLALTYFKVTIPPTVVEVFYILLKVVCIIVVAAIVIMGIRFLAGL